MKIITLSDTHLPKKSAQLPDHLLHQLKTADHIIHAGDWISKTVYDEIVSCGSLTSVAGNQDSEELKQLLPRRAIVRLNGWNIGVVHGDGKGLTTEKRAAKAFMDEEVDCIVFGHSHIPYLRFEKGVLMFNPGSATDKRRLPYYSYGILTVDKTIKAEHIFYK
ncbi:metallophosphoesterase family protein [Bacillus thermotolerans]|uniref:Phosphoesterase n=1 Tax=Bacillus thermotolerans TaxID=1221996 RepID=A0A0F5IB31_BACTR|nr:metallophosphoesterase [Bacillus thermotolerans]KKB42515.1 putative phosphoesterase [Bacillus thermotolerans]KKB44538.1 putative phosphoesterase [Bacillus thermotolerans]